MASIAARKRTIGIRARAKQQLGRRLTESEQINLRWLSELEGRSPQLKETIAAQTKQRERLLIKQTTVGGTRTGVTEEGITTVTPTGFTPTGRWATPSKYTEEQFKKASALTEEEQKKEYGEVLVKQKYAVSFQPEAQTRLGPGVVEKIGEYEEKRIEAAKKEAEKPTDLMSTLETPTYAASTNRMDYFIPEGKEPTKKEPIDREKLTSGEELFDLIKEKGYLTHRIDVWKGMQKKGIVDVKGYYDWIKGKITEAKPIVKDIYGKYIPSRIDVWKGMQKKGIVDVKGYYDWTKGKITEAKPIVKDIYTKQKEIRKEIIADERSYYDLGEEYIPTTKVSFDFAGRFEKTQDIFFRQTKDVFAAPKEIFEKIIKPKAEKVTEPYKPFIKIGFEKVEAFKVEKVYPKTRFIIKPGAERREETIDFLRGKIETGTKEVFSLSVAGQKMMKDYEKVIAGEAEPTITYKGITQRGRASIFAAGVGIAQIPVLPFELQKFSIDLTPKEKKEAVYDIGRELKESFVADPLFTTMVVGTTLLVTHKLSKGVSALRKPSAIKLSKEARVILKKAPTPETIVGEVGYGYPIQEVMQTRKVIVKTPLITSKALEPAAYFKVTKPTPKVVVATGLKTKKPISFTVTTPGGVQFATLKFDIKGKPYYIRSITPPAKMKLPTQFKIFKDDILVGKYYQKIKPTFKFGEPAIKTGVKQYISGPEMRAELKNLFDLSRVVSLKKETRPFGFLQTTTKERLVVKTLEPKYIEKIGKPVLDIGKGIITPEKRIVQIGETKYRFVEYPTTKKPARVTKLETGEVIIEKPAISLTEQIYKPTTKFRVEFEPKGKPIEYFKIPKKKPTIAEELKIKKAEEAILKQYKEGLKEPFKEKVKPPKKIKEKFITGEGLKGRIAEKQILEEKLPPIQEDIAYIQRPKEIKPIKPEVDIYDVAGKLPKEPRGFGLTGLTVGLSKVASLKTSLEKQAIISKQLPISITSQAIISKTSQIPISITSQAIISKTAQIAISKTIQKTLQETTRITKPITIQKEITKQITKKITIPIRVVIPKEPEVPIREFFFWLPPKRRPIIIKKKKKKEIRILRKYQPSLKAREVLKKPFVSVKMPKILTGLEVRPIVRNRK